MFYHFFIYWDSRERREEAGDEDREGWAHPGFLVAIQRGASPEPTAADYVPEDPGQAEQEGVVSLRPNKSERGKTSVSLEFQF